MVFIGGLDPKYVLDEMPLYEVEIALGGLHLQSKENWEQARLIVYAIAQSNSKERLKPTDIMVFPWEKEAVPKEEESEEYKAWIEQRMDDIVKEKNNGSRFSNPVVAG